MKILAILACLLSLQGCGIVIIGGAMLVAKVAYEVSQQHECEKAEGRCQ